MRYTSGGRARSQAFGIAANRRYQSGGEWQEVTSFFDVVAWANLGENVAQSLDKGDRVVVTGRLEQRLWENDAGEKRSKIEITADEVGASLRFANLSIEKLARVSHHPSQSPDEEEPIP